jgi:ribosomal protein L29
VPPAGIPEAADSEDSQAELESLRNELATVRAELEVERGANRVEMEQLKRMLSDE